jgi:hypothetical protein
MVKLSPVYIYTKKKRKKRRRIVPFILNPGTRLHLSGCIYAQAAVCPRNCAQVPTE